MSKQREISFTQELLRKGIHLISLSIPITYLFVDRTTALFLILPFTVLALIIDILSKFRNPVRLLLHKYFGKMLRSHETGKQFVLNGASWVLLSASICVLIFPKILTVVGFTILIISDIFAALIGRKYGKRPIFINKTMEGTAAFISTAMLIILIYGFAFSAPWTFFVSGFVVSILGGLIEAVSPILKVDDNLSIPIGVGMLLWVCGMIAAMLGSPFLELI